jgi:hypothetical protein
MSPNGPEVKSTTTPIYDASNDDTPYYRDLGVVDDYAPGQPDTVEQLASALSGLAEELSSDATELARVITIDEAQWSGADQNRFAEVMARLPEVLQSQVVPTLDDLASSMLRYAGELRSAQGDAAQRLSDAGSKEDTRLDLKHQKDAAPGDLSNPGKQAEMANLNWYVNQDAAGLEVVRDDKSRDDALITNSIESAGFTMNHAAVQAQDVNEQVGTINTVISWNGPGGTGGGGGTYTPPPPPPPVNPGGGVQPGGGSGGAGGTGAPGIGGGGVVNSRPSGQIPIAGHTDFGGQSTSASSDGLASSAMLAGAGLGGTGLVASTRGGTGDTETDGSSATGDGTGDSVAAAGTDADITHAKTTSARGPLLQHDGSVSLLLPGAIVLAGAVVGGWIALFGGKSPTQAAADDALANAENTPGGKVVGRQHLDNIAKKLRARHGHADGEGGDGQSQTVALPGGLVADVPASWCVSTDDNSAVLCPRTVGSFGPNIVAVHDPSGPTDPTASVAALPDSVVLEVGSLDGKVVGSSARFGYASESTGLSVHRLMVQSPFGGTVLVSATVATTRYDDDTPILDAVLRTIRPAA